METPPRILVVDDTPTNVLVLRKSLEKAGYAVLTADDGFKAVEIATQQLPDLILLDVMMPGRDGLEVCTLLKAQKDTAAIPVVFVTGVSETDRILKAFSAGGCDYITKPFKTGEVLARVSVHVRLRRAEEELRQKNDRMEELTNELAGTNHQLATLSRVDPLTQLCNRRTWEEAVLKEHERFRRHASLYSIIMIDVDNFKSFNDSQGHQAGDQCLRRIADSIGSACRQVDVVGRYGGEEFVVLAPDTGNEAAVKLAERVRKAVWALGIPHVKSDVTGRVTISLGVATSRTGSWEDVLKKADDALYVAKRAGRNMVYSDHGIQSNGDSRAPAGKRDDPDGQSGAIGDIQTSVLVVDDEPTNRTVCRGCLKRAGYLVREAVDGLTAIASVDDDPPSVIVMDVMMPNMDGLECTRKLKANPDTCNIPIIIVSALSKGDDVLAGLEAGADEYLTKPIRTSELILRVRSMARQYHDRKDLLRSYTARGEHVRALTCLVKFCRAIGASRNTDEILEHTVSTVAELVHSRRVSIMMPDEHRQRLTISKSTGLDKELAGAITVPVGQPIAGRVFASGRPTVVNSNDEAHADSKVYDSHFFASVPLISTPLSTSSQVLGVLNVTERAGKQPFGRNELEYIELIGKVAAATIQDLSVRQARDQASDSIMLALAKLAEHRDNDTGLHLDRVTRYCSMLAEDLRKLDKYRDQIDDAFMYNLIRAVPLHDIGKVAIPDHILLHPGKLTAEQMTIMRTHAEIGAGTIESLIERSPGVGFLRMAADIARYHHEWFDGSGYPLRLQGNTIPLSARICALADVYDALTTKRVYKEAISHDKAVAIILEGSGTQFDPMVAEAFSQREKEIAELASTMADTPPNNTAATAKPLPGSQYEHLPLG
ncbi:MAG: response regulator [Planctomycetota bacterium]